MEQRSSRGRDRSRLLVGTQLSRETRQAGITLTQSAAQSLSSITVFCSKQIMQKAAVRRLALRCGAERPFPSLVQLFQPRPPAGCRQEHWGSLSCLRLRSPRADTNPETATLIRRRTRFMLILQRDSDAAVRPRCRSCAGATPPDPPPSRPGWSRNGSGTRGLRTSAPGTAGGQRVPLPRSHFISSSATEQVNHLAPGTSKL